MCVCVCVCVWVPLFPVSFRLSYSPTHHMTHAAAGYYTAPFDDCNIIVVDAIGEWDTVSIWYCEYVNEKAVYKKVKSMRYPTSIGLFYSAVTARVGLKPMEDEYITMGMAAYGKPNKELYEELRRLMLKKNLHRGMNGLLSEYDDVDIAFNAQKLVENILKTFVNKLDKKLPMVYGGGVALNSVANGLILRNKQHYVFPNPGDAGSSLGAAALVHRNKINYTHSFHGYKLSMLTVDQIKHVVDVLEKGEPVGIAAGRQDTSWMHLGEFSSVMCARDRRRTQLLALGLQRGRARARLGRLRLGLDPARLRTLHPHLRLLPSGLRLAGRLLCLPEGLRQRGRRRQLRG